MAAALLGTVPAVAFGGVMTLAIVGLTALFAKELRSLRFNIRTMERISLSAPVPYPAAGSQKEPLPPTC
jgi:hypothetical protein